MSDDSKNSGPEEAVKGVVEDATSGCLWDSTSRWSGVLDARVIG